MMKITLVLVIAIVAAVSCDLASDWSSYKSQYNKIYDPKEDVIRMDIYRQNMNKINEHNKLYEAGKVTFTMGTNQFTDMTLEEIRGSLMRDPSIRAEIEELNSQWESYKTEFNKTYDDKEDSLRKELFRKNSEIIEEHNKLYEQGQSTFQMGRNNFSDMTQAEIKMRY